MIKTSVKTLPVYKFTIFDKISGIDHFITTREFAPKSDHMAGFNLSYSVNDLPQNVTHNRETLAKSMEVSAQELFIPKQTHSSRAVIVNSVADQTKLEDTDALITSRKGLCVAVMSADCVPILVYDYKNRVAAAIHAGWKGTVDNIVEKTIETMITKLGAEAKNMVAGIGPSICEKVYEVGNEVAELFDKFENGVKSKIVLPHVNSQKKFLNLQYANKQQLLNMGLKVENIEVANICTYTNHHLFYSARYFKNNCGRFATGIVIR